MNKLYIGTNWKMHKTLKEAREYTTELKRFFYNFSNHIELFIIPPFTALTEVGKILEDSRILLGAQNMHWKDEGPFTGEISPIHLKEIGVQLVELGHSERREYFNENDLDLNKKVKAALKHQLKPLICIGETSEQKDLGITNEILSIQIKTILHKMKLLSPDDVMIAYEPKWAIGDKGQCADPQYIQNTHHFIRQLLNDLYQSIGHAIPILYGGSVNIENALPILQLNNVNGLFIGRSAWDLTSFKEILGDVKNLQHAADCEVN
jgi:L-erythrulose 1-phosphate isomerase